MRYKKKWASKPRASVRINGFLDDAMLIIGAYFALLSIIILAIAVNIYYFFDLFFGRFYDKS